VIHRTSVSPVVVSVDGNITIPENTDFIDGDGRYIILIPNGNIKYLHEEILALNLERKSKFPRTWNSVARFVVTGANEFSIPQQTEIFEYLSKHRIYNYIILISDNYVFDKELSRPMNINDVDTGIKLGVYTWFPYQSLESCSDENGTTLLDISAQGQFTKNTDLFPVKSSNTLNGCTMKAVVRICEWVVTKNYIQHTNSNGIVVMIVVGMEVNLLWIVLQQMNMTLVLVPTPERLYITKDYFQNYIYRNMDEK
jgi:hypothetical protein